VHTIPDPVATSIAAAYLTTSTRSSATSAPSSPGADDAAGDPGAASLVMFFIPCGHRGLAFLINPQGRGCPGGRRRKTESDRRARGDSTQPA